MNTKKLLPCPFCGGKVIEEKHSWNIGSAKCSECGETWAHCGRKYQGRYDKFNKRAICANISQKKLKRVLIKFWDYANEANLDDPTGNYSIQEIANDFLQSLQTKDNETCPICRGSGREILNKPGEVVWKECDCVEEQKDK